MADIAYRNNIDIGGQKVKNAADATANNEYATWGQVQSFVRGITKYYAVEARATGNVSLATLDAGQALDGVTLAQGDTVLLDQQTTAAEDGIYLINADGNAATRISDLPAGASAEGIAVTVTGGTTHGDKTFIQTAEDAVIGTDGLTFVQLGSGAASGGAGMTSGFDIQAADTSVTVGTDDIAVNLNGTGGLETSSGVRVKLDGATLTRGAAGLKVTTPFDSSVHASKFSTATHASSTSITITHNLGTENVAAVTIRLEGGTKERIECYWRVNDSNSIILEPAVAPTANTWRITVVA